MLHDPLSAVGHRRLERGRRRVPPLLILEIAPKAVPQQPCGRSAQARAGGPSQHRHQLAHLLDQAAQAQVPDHRADHLPAQDGPQGPDTLHMFLLRPPLFRPDRWAIEVGSVLDASVLHTRLDATRPFQIVLECAQPSSRLTLRCRFRVIRSRRGPR